MISVQTLLYTWLVVALANFLTLTIGSPYITVIRSNIGDYFTNPDENCDSNSCYSYNSTIVGGICALSEGSCCTQCRCLSNTRTYITRAKRCMSLDQIRQYEATQTTNGKCSKFCFGYQFFEAATLQQELNSLFFTKSPEV